MNEEPRSSWVANTACSLGLLVDFLKSPSFVFFIQYPQEIHEVDLWQA